MSKSIFVENGRLFAELDDARIRLYDCRATIRIEEHAVQMPILGEGRIIDRRDVVLLITFEHAAAASVPLNALSGFRFEGEALRSDGTFEPVTFARCLLNSDLDLTEGGSCEFRVVCSQDMMDRLRQL